ncbi:MAG: magnesium protoporphyrin IX methyltransferase [Rhizobiales bacterium]|nr:magnesium protoporphyrin IX methyltransferase [Hyphomicrobiales bacterium]MBO6697263.1 magnesium protoporphyrin IX methyltransferase [Hyphomicrobiales bacterium]MBO6736482.1 magnesium protoporphyrin IX methyltransferase [Hyphomicrobiales bacterium]MBO6912952.1 magnesium protoporphyrin IX methyltransferase [Hyphomicrobiales bacterium]MBO6954120.1 magnesium protoporphyrin IX methyltransferase [Hyphomicrobiales bacterium]
MDTYQTRRGEIQAYFDRTAAKTWERLTSDAPVSGIRATVRAGRDAMRATLLSWLPDDMSGQRLLDAGCGTGALAVEAAKRGADVVAVDLSPNLVDVARERMPHNLPGTITWHAGDMLDENFGRFDHVVAMDSVIHYEAGDKVGALARLAERTDGQVLFTFAPKTPLLAAMHTVGKLFPRGDRSPAIVPISENKLRRLIAERMPDFAAGNTKRIASGFYTSQAFQITRAEPRT